MLWRNENSETRFPAFYLCFASKPWTHLNRFVLCLLSAPQKFLFWLRKGKSKIKLLAWRQATRKIPKQRQARWVSVSESVFNGIDRRAIIAKWNNLKIASLLEAKTGAASINCHETFTCGIGGHKLLMTDSNCLIQDALNCVFDSWSLKLVDQNHFL